MDRVKLEVAYRNDMSRGRMKSIRRLGFATGSICGHDSEPISVEVNVRDLAHQMKLAGGSLRSLFELEITGAPKESNGTVIIKNHYRNPITNKVLDIQFQRVLMDEKIHVSVAIELTGSVIGGMIEQTLNEIQVMSLPGEIIPKLVVDISHLKPGQHISVAELIVPENMDILTPMEAAVVMLNAPIASAATVEVEAEKPAE